MHALVRVGLFGTGMGLFLLGSAMLLVALSKLGTPPPDLVVEVIADLAITAIAAVGLWLVHLAWPGFWAATARQLRAWVSTARSWSHPVGQTLVAYVFGVVAILCARPSDAEIAGVMAAFYGFTVLNPLILAFRRRWWLDALLSVFGFLVLFVALVGTAEALEARSVGEGVLVLAPAVMAYPVLLVASGLGRWALTRRRVRRGEAPAQRT